MALDAPARDRPEVPTVLYEYNSVCLYCSMYNEYEQHQPSASWAGGERTSKTGGTRVRVTAVNPMPESVHHVKARRQRATMRRQQSMPCNFQRARASGSKRPVRARPKAVDCDSKKSSSTCEHALSVPYLNPLQSSKHFKAHTAFSHSKYKQPQRDRRTLGGRQQWKLPITGAIYTLLIRKLAQAQRLRLQV